MDSIGPLIVLFVVAFILVAGLAAAIGYFWASSQSKSDLLQQVKQQSDEALRNAQSQLQAWKDQELAAIRQQTYEAVKGQAIQEAQDQLEKWRAGELQNARLQIREVLAKESQVALEQWKVEAETQIRRDAADKSHAVTTGKMTEHLVPYLPGFAFDARDARFIGSPIDLVVFDGLSAGELQRIVFVEIKTGASSLSTRERHVRDAVLARKIDWQEIRASFSEPGTPDEPPAIDVAAPLTSQQLMRRVQASIEQEYARRAKGQEQGRP